MRRPQKRVKPLMPTNSKLSRSIRPKAAQKRVCDVSNKLCALCDQRSETKEKSEERERERNKTIHTVLGDCSTAIQKKKEEEEGIQ